MQGVTKFWPKIWHSVRWPLAVLLALYVALVIYRIPAVGEKQKTADTIAAIQAQKVTLTMVDGDALPPQPYAPENDATVAGLDKNFNGVRDDVELAIFAKYPKSAKIRAAEFQYAMSLQIMITQVFNKETWVVAAQENTRSFQCVGESVPNSGNLTKDLQIVNARIKEIDSLILNTQIRKIAKDKADDITTSYSNLRNVSNCDIDLNSLPN